MAGRQSAAHSTIVREPTRKQYCIDMIQSELRGKLHSMYMFLSRHPLHKLRYRHYKKRAIALALASTCLLISCDGAIQLCGEYACASFQSSCPTGVNCNEPKQCESAGSIRDRAPRIINELRNAQRSCSSTLQAENRTRLVWDVNLASASQSHSRDMAENRFESFIGTNGLSSSERVELFDFQAQIVTESIGIGAQTTAEIINQWLDVQTDCEQMLLRNTSKIGMACTLSDERDATPYWSLLLASPQTGVIQQ